MPATDAGGTPPGYMRTRRRENVRWVPPGGLINVQGFDIHGMVYVGEFMTCSPGGNYPSDAPAACLIDPGLKVASRRPGTLSDLGYWPSYSNITPEQRLAYLTWLNTGKSDTSYPIGFVFLYFYGLERRLLIDPITRDEETKLVAEVERLRSLFGSNRSFGGYSRALLDMVALRRDGGDTAALEAWKPDVMSMTRDVIPMPLQLKLALHAVSGVPVDWELATAAMLAFSPYRGGPSYSIGMSRTRREFIELVRRRFTRKFPNGYVLKDRKDSHLQLWYQAAAQNLGITISFEGVKRLPDPTTLNWGKVAELCGQAAIDLGAYAKAVGKDLSRTGSMAAAMALPPDLSDLGANGPFRKWLDELPAPVAPVSLSALGHWCFGEGKEVSGSKQAREMSEMLRALGYGYEPDPTCGGEKPGTNVLVFQLREGWSTAPMVSPAFHQAALVAAVLTAGAPAPDGVKVVTELATRLKLRPLEAIRLAARHRLMQGRPPAPGKLKTMVSALPECDLAALANLAAAVAGACGEVSHATQTLLERLHDVCGVDRRDLYVVLHDGAAAAGRKATTTTDSPPETTSRTSGLAGGAPPSKPPATTEGGVQIDMDRVAAIMRETAQVSAVLAPIYEDEDYPPAAQPPSGPAGGAGQFTGLEARHAALLGELVAKASWGRAEFEAKARAHDLMPDGAIEKINEWAFDELGDSLIENGDPMTIDMALLPDAPEEAA